MRKFLIATHGNFANGIAQSLTMFLGEKQPFSTICAYVDDTSLEDQIVSFMNTVEQDDQLIILTDIMGGSVNQQMIRYLQRPNTFLITGFNFPLLLALSLLPDDVTIDELRHLIEEARNSIYLMNDYKFVTTEEGDE